MDRPVRILVVDDDAPTRRLLSAALSSEALYEVVTARDATEAQRIFHDSPGFDLILTDLNMPLVSGIELVTNVRAQGSKTTRRVRVTDAVDRAVPRDLGVRTHGDGHDAAALAGRIERNGVHPQDIAYLPQVAEIDRTFPINVYDMVAMGLWRSKGLFGGIGGKDRDTVESAIAAVGLTGFELRPIGTLSGGQMQRMLFARLLLQDARVIVLDEPFNAIDAKTSSDLLALVRRWHDEQRTVLAALHDLELVKTHFPEALLLAREPVAWGHTAEVLTPDNWMKARRMCEAFDEQAEACVVAEAV